MSFFTRLMSDIRTVIAAVLGIIGCYLIVCSVFRNGPDEMAKTGNINANLWAGLVMVGIAVAMTVWRFVSLEEPARAADTDSEAV